MCHCSGSKDQTKEVVFDYLQNQLQTTSSNQEILGFGLFVIPAPENGILEVKTLTVENLSYIETTKRGNNCLAFQWIPKGISITTRTGEIKNLNTLEDLNLVILDCTSSRCKPSGCPMGCFCFGNETGNCHH